MQRRSYNIDFTKKCGRPRAMHGTNLSFERNTLGDNPVGTILSRHAPPIVGLHDVEYPYGQNQFVDIHCIFPDTTADTESEESYNFGPTDAYLKKVKESGAEIVFRLGESVDNFTVKPFLKMPTDLERLARICIHVVMHYNAKWASGYKWNIKYFEIWSGADRKCGFGGELSDYVELYTVISKALKAEFPRIKLGGYSSVGFGAMNRVGGSEEERAAYSFAERFLTAIAKREAPLDFFSWCSKSSGAEELSLHTKYAKALIKSSPYRSAKSVITEFDISSRTAPDAAEYLAAMITADKSDVEFMLYKYAGKSEEKELADAIYSAAYRGGDRAAVSEDYKRELYLLATHGEAVGHIIIASTGFSGAVELLMQGAPFGSFDITEISKREDGAYSRAGLSNSPIRNEKIVFSVKPHSLYRIALK